MPGGTGPVNRATLAACAAQDRALAALGSANEIFFNLDSRRVYYDRAACYLYFVADPQDTVVRTIRSALAGMHAVPVIEQLHLDAHRFFNGARRVGLVGAQAATVLVALRLAGVRATIR